MQRFHIPNMGPEESNIPKAFGFAVKLCQDLGVSDLTLVVPKKGGLSHTVIGKFLGDAPSQQLMSGKKLPLKPGLSLVCESPQTLKKRNDPDVVLAFYISPSDLNVIDALTRTKAAIFVPWLDADGVAWQKTWNAQVPGAIIGEHRLGLPVTVEAGLRTLTNRVNLSTGLSHPSDKQHAKKVFSDLRAQSVIYDPADVRIWAVRNGWRPDDADELAQLAIRYLR
jgi:hypothetical protein